MGTLLHTAESDTQLAVPVSNAEQSTVDTEQTKPRLIYKPAFLGVWPRDEKGQLIVSSNTE